MTEKEEAIDLVTKFTRIEDDTVFYWNPYWDERREDEEVLPHAQKCAVITCDRMIKQLEEANLKELASRWLKVKQEVKSLKLVSGKYE